VTEAHPAHASVGARNGEGAIAVLGVAERLYLAATPTFAIMALLTALGGNPVERLCSSEGGTALSGMGTMYVLMAVFHSRPWLKLIAGKLVEQGRER
jgi:hypothetical protein